MAVIGRILLVLLVFLLIVLLLFLFFPITYRIGISKTPENLTAKVKCKWLFGFIRCLYDYPSPGNFIVKVAFFTIVGKPQKRNNRNTKTKHTKKEKKRERKNNVDSISEIPENEDKSSENPEEKSDLLQDASAEHIQVTEQCAESELPKKSQKSTRSDRTFDLSTKWKSLTTLFSKLKKDYCFFRSLWFEPDTKDLISYVIKRLIHIFRHVLPRKIIGHVYFGADSPDVTGYIYGGYSVISTLFPKRFLFEFVPDFENKRLEAEVKIKGHAMIIVILFDSLKVIFDRRLRAKIKRIRTYYNKRN